MDAAAATKPNSLDAREQIRLAREVVLREGQALLGLADKLGPEVSRAVDLLFACQGCVIVTGMGKAGLIGQKITATLASTGTRSHFLHPAEAVHGDLGRIHRDDVVLVLSQSGETDEVVRLLPSLAKLGVPLVAITCRPNSSLGQAATVTLDLGPLDEACLLGLAPSTTTTAMLAMGDALALVTSRMRDFGPEDFARFHPGGSLGRMLARVEDIMRPLDQCRIAGEEETLRQVFGDRTKTRRRTGAIMLVDREGSLAGIFTDSDFARLFAKTEPAELARKLDGPMREVMTVSPMRIALGSMARSAVEILAERKISELPVVDADGKPCGLIDITDVVALAPSAKRAAAEGLRVDGAHPANSAEPANSAPSAPAAGEEPVVTVPFVKPRGTTRRTQ